MHKPFLSPGTILASCLILSCGGPGGGAESGGSTSTGVSTTETPTTISSTTGGDDPTGAMTGTTTSSPTTSGPGPTTEPETTSEPETTTETTGPIETTAATTTDATTTDATGTGTTGPVSACADLNEADCAADADCMVITGSKINVDKMCFAPAQFLGCIDSMGCDDAITTACKLNNPEPWQFPSGCIPGDFEPCRGMVADMMCP
jgi:hypothetical protein